MGPRRSSAAIEWSVSKKDELDLIRLAEAYPRPKSVLPGELRDQIDKG
jgi:hypothetical protein